MPVQTSGEHKATSCSIIGSFDTLRIAVRHVALLAENTPLGVGAGCEAVVMQMNPPLTRDGTAVDVLGWLRDLNEHERELINQCAIELVRGAKGRRQYIVHPPWQDVKDKKNTTLYIRFSCAGFVAYCYFKAGRELVDRDQLPSVGLELLKQIWDDQAEALDSPEKRHWCGLVGKEESWHVLLPSYLLHAIRAHDSGKSLPLVPTSDDWKFP